MCVSLIRDTQNGCGDGDVNPSEWKGKCCCIGKIINSPTARKKKVTSETSDCQNLDNFILENY